MKFSYDKLLLGLGVLALLAGIVFSLINLNQTVSEGADTSQPVSKQYEPIPVPDFGESVAVWPNAVEQAPGELYDVFTPPTIWIDKNGTFIFESPIDDLPPVPFGIYLAELKNEPYRIQLEGYIEEDFNDAKKSVLLLYDEEKKESIRARVGESIKEHEFAVYDFTIDRVRDSNGILKIALATILDFRDGRRIFLTHGERKYKNRTTVVFRSEENKSFEIRINEELPYEFTTTQAKYTLEKINLEESSVTVTKTTNGNVESETKKLFLKSNPTPNKSFESKSANRDSIFEFDF
jgi:hypothetical protein